MPTICPNCLRPVRTDAKYCGYCGTNLVPSAREEILSIPVSRTQQSARDENTGIEDVYKSRGGKGRRVVLVLLIVLLCLVLLYAFLTHYYPTLLPYLGSLLSSLIQKYIP